MSTVITDNLTGKTAAGNVTITSEGGSATMQLQQGVAKAWVQYTSIGTTAAQDSLNVTSLTDNGTGDTDANWSSVFANNDYAITTSCERSAFYHAMLHGIANTATNHVTLTTATSTSSAEDAEEGHCICMGDLA
jgi:hypothetical protein